jgi:hypothetical protein
MNTLGNKLATNYWIFKVKDEVGGIFGRRGFAIFEHRIKERFWCIKETDEKGRPQPNTDLLKKDDAVVFYLVGKGGSRFVGTAVLDSGYVQLNEEQTQGIVHRDFLDGDTGVFLKKVDKWAKPLPIESLRGKESWVAAGGKFGAYFQGSIKKMKDNEEYDIIIREHELTA